jgi:thioesterase domain-containing protein/acyl carrier protein
VGEVVVRGETVIEAYLNDTHTNGSTFVGGWFRTGDQGYQDDDDYLFLIGRSKEMINRGGEKISPREIDEVLLEHPGIAQAMTFAVPDVRLGEAVAAAVVAQRGIPTPAPREIRSFAARRLADHKVPEVVYLMDEVPRGATGKPQRGELARSVEADRPALDEADDALDLQRETVTHKLTAIWRRCLLAENVGMNDHFMDLGGDSVTAADMLVQVYDATGIDVPLLEFLDDPTIYGLTKRCRDRPKQVGSGPCPVTTLRKGGAKGVAEPVFCLPPHNDDLWGLSHLVRHLDEDRPAYALRAGSDPAVVRKGIPHVAARSIELMKTFQSRPPYCLIGFCFGGFVAIEMASQLTGDDEDLACLTMIDVFNPQWYRRLTRRDWLRHELKFRAYAHWYKTRRFLSQSLFDPGMTRRGGQDRRSEQALPDSLLVMNEAAREARGAYQPKPYRGPVLLVRSMAPRPWAHYMPKLGWGDIVDGRAVELRLSCDRPEIWRPPYVVEVASAVERMIAGYASRSG